MVNETTRKRNKDFYYYYFYFPILSWIFRNKIIPFLKGKNFRFFSYFVFKERTSEEYKKN